MAGKLETRNNIVLIGFMGTGKTTAGRLLAERTGRTFVDLDEEIERLLGMPVSAIFAQYGESFFREQEQQIIRQIICRSNIVFATGGGAVLLEENIRNLQQCGLIITLKCQPEVIIKRIVGDTAVRPLLNRENRLQVITELLQERCSRYETANFCIDTSLISTDEVVKKMEDLITIWKDSILLAKSI
ncbi:shikimate kinase [Anaerospora sp.]|uniref:shikimate kinase n=1 Tax=Anaerospora sp. TaxID=1960278 RepID=UPI0028A2310E|nr:shikimate kinase [Anaerospora sp.]